MIENINANTKTIRYELSQRVCYQLRNSRTVVFPRRFARLHRKHRFSTEKVNAPYEPPRPENSMALLVFKNRIAPSMPYRLSRYAGVAITTLVLVCIAIGLQRIYGADRIALLPNRPADKNNSVARQNSRYRRRGYRLAEWNEVKTFTPVIEENALCIYKDRQRPVLVKGVP